MWCHLENFLHISPHVYQQINIKYKQTQSSNLETIIEIEMNKYMKAYRVTQASCHIHQV